MSTSISKISSNNKNKKKTIRIFQKFQKIRMVFFKDRDLCHSLETALKRGYRAEGLAVVLGGIFNTFPYTTFSQNVGLLELSGIKTKRPIYWSAALLMLLGLLPKAGALATMIPTPVLGGAMLVMFAMITVQGIRLLAQVDFSKQRNVLLVAISLGLGLGVSIYPTIFQALPKTVQLFLGNGIVVASLSSVILNLIFNGKKAITVNGAQKTGDILEKIEDQ